MHFFGDAIRCATQSILFTLLRANLFKFLVIKEPGRVWVLKGVVRHLSGKISSLCHYTKFSSHLSPKALSSLLSLQFAYYTYIRWQNIPWSPRLWTLLSATFSTHMDDQLRYWGTKWNSRIKFEFFLIMLFSCCPLQPSRSWPYFLWIRMRLNS